MSEETYKYLKQALVDLWIAGFLTSAPQRKAMAKLEECYKKAKEARL